MSSLRLLISRSKFQTQKLRSISAKTFSSSSSSSSSSGCSKPTIPLLLIPNSNLFSATGKNKIKNTSSYPYCFFSLSNLKEAEEDKKKVLTLNDKEPSHRLPPWDREFLFPNTNTCTDNYVRYIGSSHGWISCCTNPSSNLIFLFNPLSPSESIIFLPPLPTLLRDIKCDRENYLNKPHSASNNFHHFGARKLILSSPTSDPNCRAVVVDSIGYVWMCKPGDSSWTQLPGNVSYPGISAGEDIVYSNRDQCLYVLNETDQSLDAWDLSDPKSPKRSQILTGFDYFVPGGWPDPERYLVQTSSDLLLVVRYLDGGKLDSSNEEEVNTLYPNNMGLKPEHFINEFDVYSLDAKSRRWKYGSLGRNAVFIGKNHSFSIDVGARKGGNLPVEANSIYFTENCYYGYGEYELFDADSHGGCDMLVYNKKKSEAKRHYFRDTKKKSTKQPPIWLLPDPNFSMETLVETEVDTYWGRIPKDLYDSAC